MKYIIQGKGPIVVSKDDFVTEGGEGKIFITGSTVLKVFSDLSKVTPQAKLKELSILDHPCIIRPKDVLLDERNKYVGFTMDVIPNNVPLCKLFATSFRTRNGVTPESINKLVEKMQEVIVFIHDRKCLIVDGNEMNYLADDKTFTVPYFIDVNSYQTPSFPATVIMPSIRDWKSKIFNTLTDWFSFAIVSFQLFVGIHPFKGSHPDFNQPDLIERIKARVLANISVLNPRVSIPPSTRDFSYIPAELMSWYIKIFENGERIPPPQVSGLLNVKPAQVTIVQSTNNFIIQLVKEYPNEIVRNKFWNGIGCVNTTKELYINKVNYPLKTTRGVDTIFSPKMMIPILSKIEDDSLKIYIVPTDEVIETGIEATDKLVVENTLYARNKGNILEIIINEIGKKIVPSVKATWNIMPKSSIIFNGVIYQNVLGKSFLVIPKPEEGKNSSCFTIATPELDGYRILDAKHEHRVCMVTGVKGANYDKFVFRFSEDFTSYDCRTIPSHSSASINFTVLDNGVCVSINDDSNLEVFANNLKTNKITEIKDPDINSNMILSHDGVKVMFFQANKLYSLSMKK